MAIRSFTDQELINAVSESISYNSVIEKLGLHICGGNQQSIRKHISRLGISTSHFLGKSWNRGNIAGLKNYLKRDLSDILIENSTYINANHLKNRLIKEGIFEYKCYRCGRTKWEGELIPIQIDHINGIHNDNRLENLTILCPNCHALTPTYCGKNKKRVNKKLKNKRLIAKKKRNIKKGESLNSKLSIYREKRRDKAKKLFQFFSKIDKLNKEAINEAMQLFGYTSISGIRYQYDKYKKTI